ncbi:MAG TPA: 4'-phosphopantetheinyl transferase superfamily protein [Acetobacteraceae bacterium]
MPQPRLATDVAEGEIALFRWRLDASPGGLAACHVLLSAEERSRAGRMIAPAAEHFIAAHGGMRRILGACVGQHPAALRLVVGPFGKPHLPDHPELRFSLSHSRGLAILAATRGMEVGVDIELCRPVRDGLAERYFAPSEAAALRALPEPDRTVAFFACWTRKEAFVKALGTGLSTRLDSFEVSVRPDEPARLVHVAGDAQEAARWRLHDLAPAPGYAGAVALRNPSARLVCRVMEPSS